MSKRKTACGHIWGRWFPVPASYTKTLLPVRKRRTCPCVGGGAGRGRGGEAAAVKLALNAGPFPVGLLEAKDGANERG